MACIFKKQVIYGGLVLGLNVKAQLNNTVMQLRKNCNHPDLLTSQFESDSKSD